MINIVESETDAIYVLEEFHKKFPHLTTTSVTQIHDFILNELFNRNSSTECTKDDWICSKSERLCRYPGSKITLTSDEPVNGSATTITFQAINLISTTSFSDWCNGRMFTMKNKITMDSEFIRIITFNTTNPNTFNNKIYNDPKEEYERSSYFDKNLSLIEFVDDQLRKFNAPASQILYQVCNKFKKSFNNGNNDNKLQTDLVSCKLKDLVRTKKFDPTKVIYLQSKSHDLKNDSWDDNVALNTGKLISGISFPDWCKGRRFKTTNNETTDNAFVRLLLYNSTRPNTVNIRSTTRRIYNRFI